MSEGAAPGPMSSWTHVTFESGDRPVGAVEADVLALADDDPDVWVEGEDVVLYRSAPLFELEDVEPPTDRALSFWGNDTSMWGGGILYEAAGGAYRRVDVHSDTDGSYGRDARSYFRVEHGIRGYRR
jgi:hypothetical protein